MSSNNGSQQYATPTKRSTDADRARDLVASPSTPATKVTDFNSVQLFQAKDTEMKQLIAATDAQENLEQHQQLYEKNKESLLGAIDQTSNLLHELRDFNNNKRIIHYTSTTSPPSKSTPSPNALKRSNSLLPGQNFEAVADASKPSRPVHPSLQRCYTSQASASSLPNTPERKVTSRSDRHDDDEEQDEEMSVLKLDLRVGSVTSNPHALVRSLERSSVAQLLDGRMEKSERHLENLKQRISDTQSKVLVTGDLNAGKSTFVNALLRRNIMPTDQQPCTTVFCEVLDATESNNGVEEVHMIKPGSTYDRNNAETFSRHSLDEIESIVAEAEEFSPEDAPILKCYAQDTRATQDSLLKNGIVDIALIDAPGLNRDSLKTTALFARQEEIDVVVFVVSAENHFTLSAKEFLWNASHDKAYVFIVVNKYDQIKNKEKCRKLVLDQIRQLSPRTYEDAANLVHFVDSNAVFGADSDASSSEADAEAEKSSVVAKRGSDSLRAFARLEAALRDFVLLKRSKSKLLPSKTYMLRLLSDIAFLAKINTAVAKIELDEARKALAVARPALAQCQANQAKLETVLEGEEDDVVTSVTQNALNTLMGAIERIGNGQPAVDAVSLPAYKGLFNVWEYAQEVRHALTGSLEIALRGIEDTTRGTTSQAVERVQQMGENHLPEEAEKRQRIFNPEAMFAKRRSLPGLVGLGLGPQVVEVQPSDFFDFYHHLSIVTGGFGSGDGQSGKKSDSDEELSLVSSLSLGLGAVTLVGGKAFGARTAIDAFIRISDLVGNPTARRWAGPVFALVSTGLVVYFVIDLPNSIPRNVGRSIKAGLTSGSAMRQSNVVEANAVIKPSQAASPSTAGFSTVHSTRVGRETRKVLRLASWDLQERFRVAIAQRRAEVEREEAKEKDAGLAIEWFGATDERVQSLRKSVDSVDLSELA